MFRKIRFFVCLVLSYGLLFANIFLASFGIRVSLALISLSLLFGFINIYEERKEK